MENKKILLRRVDDQDEYQNALGNDEMKDL